MNAAHNTDTTLTEMADRALEALMDGRAFMIDNDPSDTEELASIEQRIERIWGWLAKRER